MDKRRIINTRFWDDVYIAGLSPHEKLVFLYLISSPLTNISGVYELPVKRAALDVSLEIAQVETILTKFEEDGKVARFKGWLGVTNFIAHQTLNPKIIQGIVNGLRKAPKEVVDRLCIDYQRLGIEPDSLSHHNHNNNNNANQNGLPLGELSTEEAQLIHKGRKALVEKMTVKR